MKSARRIGYKITRVLKPAAATLVAVFAYIGLGVGRIAGAVVRVLFWIIKLPISLRGRARTRAIILATFLFILWGGNFISPQYWNASAAWINQRLEQIDMPSAVEQYDQWGMLERLDGIARIPVMQEKPFALGLDLQGGAHLVYEADSEALKGQNVQEAMEGLRDVIERRVNLLGVSEPVVQYEQSGDSQHLIVELAGVYDTNEAIKAIGQTPYLEFKRERPDAMRKEILEGAQIDQELIDGRESLCQNGQFIAFFMQAYGGMDPCFEATELTGKYLAKSEVQFDQYTNQPQIGLRFNDEGTRMFEELTAAQTGRIVSIYLDNTPISLPRVQEKISGGQAQITGEFTLDEAKDLVRNLNAGALPVPVRLISQQTIGATLGEDSLQKSLKGGMWGVLLVVSFMIILYRFSGLLSVIALAFYAVTLLVIFKVLPVTLTLPGIAGVILSIGMAVDANILVFERLREELGKEGVSFLHSLERSYERAWPSVRDGHASTLLTCAILFWFSTGFVKGFALTLGIGVAMSMFTAMVITKHLMRLWVGTRLEKWQIWSRG